MKFCALLLLFLVCLFLSTSVYAESEAETGEETEYIEDEEAGDDDEGADTDEDGMEGLDFPGRFLRTRAIFPAYESLAIPAGDVVEVLAGVRTGGKEDISVIAIRGRLTSPFDQSQVIQNFSLAIYNQTVPAESSHNFWYRFMPAPQLEARQYSLILDLFYMGADNNTYFNPLFNSTIEVLDPPSVMDVRTVFMYFLIVIVLAVSAYGGASILKPAPKKRAARPVEAATVASADVDDAVEFVNKAHLAFRKGASVESPSKVSGRKSSSRK